MKVESPAWAQKQSQFLRDYQGPAGCGACSVGQSPAGHLKRNIANPAEHRREMTDQAELRLLMKRHEIAFDARSIWD